MLSAKVESLLLLCYQFFVNACTKISLSFGSDEGAQQFATAMIAVFVNGQLILKDGDTTCATPGRFIKGLGYKIQ